MQNNSRTNVNENYIFSGEFIHSSGKLHFRASNWRSVWRELLLPQTFLFRSVKCCFGSIETRQNFFFGFARTASSTEYLVLDQIIFSSRAAMKMWIARDWFVISVSYAVECIRQNDLKCFEDKTSISSVFGDRSVFMCRLRCVDSFWMNKLWPFFLRCCDIFYSFECYLRCISFVVEILGVGSGFKVNRIFAQLRPNQIHRRNTQLFLGRNFFSIVFFHFSWYIGEAIKLHWHRKWHEHTIWQPTASHRAILVDLGIRDIRVEWKSRQLVNVNNGFGNYLLVVSLSLNILTMLRCKLWR